MHLQSFAMALKGCVKNKTNDLQWAVCLLAKSGLGTRTEAVVTYAVLGQHRGNGLK